MDRSMTINKNSTKIKKMIIQINKLIWAKRKNVLFATISSINKTKRSIVNIK